MSKNTYTHTDHGVRTEARTGAIWAEHVKMGEGLLHSRNEITHHKTLRSAAKLFTSYPGLQFTRVNLPSQNALPRPLKLVEGSAWFVWSPLWIRDMQEERK